MNTTAIEPKPIQFPACWGTVLKRAKWEVVEPERQEWLATMEEENLADSPAGMRELRDRLVSILGKWVVMVSFEEDLEEILSRGELMVGGPHGGKPLMRRGDRCQCHSNSAACWEANRDKLELCTGYGLSADYCWRQHSWCWYPAKKRVIETTEPRIVYYGFRMTDKEALDHW